jgi:hypothetical protein
MGLGDRFRGRLVRKVSLKADDPAEMGVTEPEEIATIEESGLLQKESGHVAESVFEVPPTAGGREQDGGADHIAENIFEVPPGVGRAEEDEEADSVAANIFEVPPTASKGEEEDEEVDKGLFASIFGKEDDDEATPATLLAASMPDISPDELLDELEELKEVMRGWYLQ